MQNVLNKCLSVSGSHICTMYQGCICKLRSSRALKIHTGIFICINRPKVTQSIWRTTTHESKFIITLWVRDLSPSRSCSDETLGLKLHSLKFHYTAQICITGTTTTSRMVVVSEVVVITRSGRYIRIVIYVMNSVGTKKYGRYNEVIVWPRWSLSEVPLYIIINKSRTNLGCGRESRPWS